MTKSELVQAYSMRIHGESWESIAVKIGYDPQTVSRSVRASINRESDCKIPAELNAWITHHCGGSVNVFCAMAKVSPSRFRKACESNEFYPSLSGKIKELTGVDMSCGKLPPSKSN